MSFIFVLIIDTKSIMLVSEEGNVDIVSLGSGGKTCPKPHSLELSKYSRYMPLFFSANSIIF